MTLRRPLLLLTLLALIGCMQNTVYREPWAERDSVTVYGMNAHHGLLGQLSPCGDPRVWDQVRARFNGTEAIYGTSGITLGDISGPMPAGEHEKYDGKVGRRWCEALGWFSDNRQRRIAIELASGTETIGEAYGLHICVDGIDPYMTYAPACRVLRMREF